MSRMGKSSGTSASIDVWWACCIARAVSPAADNRAAMSSALSSKAGTGISVAE